MVEVAGVEDDAQGAYLLLVKECYKSTLDEWTQIWTQISDSDRRNLSNVVSSWLNLPPR